MKRGTKRISLPVIDQVEQIRRERLLAGGSRRPRIVIRT
jgi:hypothetical protein